MTIGVKRGMIEKFDNFANIGEDSLFCLDVLIELGQYQMV